MAGLPPRGHATAPPYVEPWHTVQPGEHGFDARALLRLEERLAKLETRAWLVARGNRLVHEWYRWSYRHLVRDPAGELRTTASMAKAVIGTTAFLLLLGDGLVRIEDRAAGLVPAWADDPVRSRITLAQLASHSSGLDDATVPGTETAADPLEAWEREFWEEPASRIRLAIERAPMRFAPGERVLYSNPGYEVLGYALAAAMRRADRGHLDGLLRRRVMEPLGLGPELWSISYGEVYELDGLRLFEMGGGAQLSPRALVRLGQLYLDRGRVGALHLLDPGTVASTLQPTRAALPPGWQEARHPAPALGWWSNASGVWRSAPRDTLVGAGLGHQLVIVIPSLDLVAVRFGRRFGQSAWEGDYWIALEDELLAPLVAAADG